MDKSPRDISLYAPYVLRILTLVLSSKDISMVEETIPTFETFCEHQGHAILMVDQELAKLYDGVVRAYAGFAEKQSTAEKAMTTPIAIRWKSAGLKALKSISSTDTMMVDRGKQLSTVIPVLLKNFYSHDDKLLLSMYHKAGLEKDTPSRRRGSVSTSRTSVQIDRPNPVLSNTTAGADREAAEEAATLALYSLKQVFSAQNRGQTRLATSNVLNFLTSNAMAERPKSAISPQSDIRADWSTTLIEMIASWTPVQDRFVIIVTAIERLIRYAPSEENLGKQLTIARLVHYLLSSSINMIGLSVIDILLALMQQVLVVLQVSGSGANILPVHPRLSAIELFTENSQDSTNTGTAVEAAEPSMEPSVVRQDLLKTLESCMADLAIHIYYGDQISDIVTAILSRLKPSTKSSVPNPIAAVERPAAAVQVIAESGNLKEDSNSDDFFSFGTARVIALNAVKQVLINANRRTAASGAGAIGRNKVTVRVWEGTQWLLRDEDRRVRRAYVSALLTWLSLELGRKDLRIIEASSVTKKNRIAPEDTQRTASSVVRAASSASKGGRVKSLKTTFLQLLHLAIYDNVIESPEDNSDILLMHLLLTSLSEKLGINAVKSGLPMILRLDEDIDVTETCRSLRAKVNVGSLVHGYLLNLSRVFDFESTMPGYEIGSEISRRKKAALWLDAIQLPPLAVDKIVGASYLNNAILGEPHNDKPLKHFGNDQALVNQIGIGYANQQLIQPQSPPQSPNRGISMMSTSSILAHNPEDNELPQEFKDSLLARWSKETCIASIEKDTRSSSPHGSRSGTTYSVNNGLLSAKARSTKELASGLPDFSQDNKASNGGLAIITAAKRYRSASANGSGPPTPMSTIESHTLRMDDLKRVLAGQSMTDAMSDLNRRSSFARGGSPLRSSSTAQSFGNIRRNTRNGYRPSIVSVGSDSIVNAEGFESASEGDPEHPLPTPQSPVTVQEIQNFQSLYVGQDYREIDPASRRIQGARSNSTTSAEDPEANAKALKGELIPPVLGRIFGKEEHVPPVPPLPQGIKEAEAMARHDPASGRAVSSTPLSGSAQQHYDKNISKSFSTNRLSTPSSPRNGSSRIFNNADSNATNQRTFVHSLLDSIEVNDQNEDIGVRQPPY